jgi:hypothetical protein
LNFRSSHEVRSIWRSFDSWNLACPGMKVTLLFWRIWKDLLRNARVMVLFFRHV